MDGFYFDSTTALSTSLPLPMFWPPSPREVRATVGFTALGQIVDAKVTGPEISTRRSSVERRFDRLVSKWKASTQFMSAIDDMAMNPNYQHIIGMGEPAVPFILRRIKTEPDFWFWALHAITGADPVPKRDLGNLHKMSAAWLRWGKKKGYSV